MSRPWMYIADICILFLVIISCSCNKNKTSAITNEDQIEIFLQEAKDSIYQNRSYSFDQLYKAKQLATDSINFYRVLNSYAESYFYINEFDSAKNISEQILAFCERQESSVQIDELRSASYNYLGNYYIQMYSMDSSFYYYGQALEYAIKTGSSVKIPDLYINLADISVRKGDYASGSLYYRKALSVSDSLHITEKMSFPIYFGLGQVYMELRDFDLSDSYYRLAEKYYEGRPLSEKFTFCNNRGNYFYYKEEYANALPWFRKALSLVSGGDYKFYESLCQLNLGDIFFNLNEPDSVHYYLDRSYSYFSTINNSTALYYIATINAGLALRDNNTKLAGKFLEKTKDETGVDFNMISIHNRYLQDYYVRTGNYKDAYLFQSKNVLMNDSIRTDRAKKRAIELDMRYRQDTTLMKKELIIKNQASEVDNLKLSIFAWAFGCALIILMAVFIYYYMKRQHDMQRLTYLNQVTKLRMDNIRNRISPHFILNTLNHEITSVDEARKSELFNLVKLLRKSLEMTEQNCISLLEELDFVKTYIELEAQNLGKDFYLEWNIDAQIDQDKVCLPPMIIQIPVENAIKHALRPKVGEKILIVTVCSKEKGIFIVIEDNGNGYSPGMASPTRGTGTGTKVMYQTIGLLNGKNKEKITLSISGKERSGESGTKVDIYIPYNYSFE